jgi:LytS/YehU family sensor histidine kinase
MRLGPRISVAWSIDPKTQRTLLPQLILQAREENAVRHGIACSREGGWVEIASGRHGNRVDLCIRNRMSGGKRTAGMGAGLKNTEARSRFLYADEASFTFAEGEDHTATATIVLPALGPDSEGSAEPALLVEIETIEGNHARVDRGR